MSEAVPMVLIAAAGAALGALVGPKAAFLAPAAVAGSYFVAHLICQAVSGGDAR